MIRRDRGAAVVYLLGASAAGFILFGATFGPACSRPPVPVVPDSSSDASVLVASDCSGSCAAFARLDCSEALPTPAGASCLDVCLNLADAGIDAAKQLSCAATATDCAALRACPY